MHSSGPPTRDPPVLTPTTDGTTLFPVKLLVCEQPNKMSFKDVSISVRQWLFSIASNSARTSLQLVIAIDSREICLLQILSAWRRAMNLWLSMAATFLLYTGLSQTCCTTSINPGCKIQYDSKRKSLLRGILVSMEPTQGIWYETGLSRGLTRVLWYECVQCREVRN